VKHISVKIRKKC